MLIAYSIIVTLALLFALLVIYGIRDAAVKKVVELQNQHRAEKAALNKTIFQLRVAQSGKRPEGYS